MRRAWCGAWTMSGTQTPRTWDVGQDGEAGSHSLGAGCSEGQRQRGWGMTEGCDFLVGRGSLRLWCGQYPGQDTRIQWKCSGSTRFPCDQTASPSLVFLQRVGLHWAPRSLRVFLFLIRVLSRVHAPTAGSEALTVLTVVSVFLPRSGVQRQPRGAPLCAGLLPEKAAWNLCCKQAAGGFFIHLENSL